MVGEDGSGGWLSLATTTIDQPRADDEDNDDGNIRDGAAGRDAIVTARASNLDRRMRVQARSTALKGAKAIIETWGDKTVAETTGGG